MRIYIIGDDGITLCRAVPAVVNDGEIAVASNEELHAARLSGKQLLALWNALPGVEKRRKIGDRDAQIDQLWPLKDGCSRDERPTAPGVCFLVHDVVIREIGASANFTAA